ncbi:MAG: lactonase family protein [Terriglobales bacterium]
MASAGSNSTFWFIDTLAVTPNGKYLYSADYDTGAVTPYEINQTTGALTPLSSLVLSEGELACIAATDSFVYIADYDFPGVIYVAQIGSDGTLTLVDDTTNIADLAAEEGPESMAIDATGKYLYVGGWDQIFGFSIGTDGKLTSLASGAPVALPNGPGGYLYSTTFTRDNAFIYMSDSNNGPHAFTFNVSSGAISELTSSPFGSDVVTGGSIVVDASNSFVYAAQACGKIVGFRRDTTTGALTELTGLPATAQNAACSVAAVP